MVYLKQIIMKKVLLFIKKFKLDATYFIVRIGNSLGFRFSSKYAFFLLENAENIIFVYIYLPSHSDLNKPCAEMTMQCSE